MIELLTLASSSIRQNGAELTGLSAHKQKLALLTYIGVEGPVSRDNLLGMFWPEKPEAKARHSLSQALYALRKELGEDCVRVVGDKVDLSEEVTVDVKRMQVVGQQERWEEVVELYGGLFLDQFYLPETPGFEDWQSRTRAWVSSLARKAFARVIASRYAAGDLTGALDIAWRWTKLEPLEDEAQHALIALLAISGDRPRALDQYEAYRDRLERDLGVHPLEPTAAMIEGIRSGILPERLLLSDVPAAEPARPSIGSPLAAIPPPSDLQISPLENVNQQLVSDELAPKLEIIRLLSQSLTSIVYLAEEPELRRRVVVKVFSPKLASDRRARMRFEREVLAVASLVHPNIAALHWAGSLSNGLPYFVMQYVEGPTMADKLRVEGRRSSEETRQILAQLASALASAHRRGIVHRNVQPKNILCDEESRRCLLTDFGIAAILAAGERPDKITESGELVGDPVWMSPEQAQATAVSERSDVYALGLLGYQLLAEDSPYAWDSKQELYDAHASGKPRKLSELCPGVDPDLESIIHQCLAKEARKRPSASQLARELSSPTGPMETKEPEGLIARLFWRRVPQWLGVYLAGGYAIVELVQTAAARGHLAEGTIDITLISYLLGVPVVPVLAWYHGRAGPQKMERLEVWLLGAVAFVWLLVLAAVWLL